MQDYCVQREIPVPRWRREVNQEEELAFHANVLRAMKDLGFQVAEEDRQAVAREVANRITGMGVLQPYLEQEGIEEIIVRKGFVQVERDGQIHDVGELAPDVYFYRLTRRIADLEGKEIGAEDPQIKLGLPDGSRFTAAIPPLSREGTAINIRRFSRKKLTFEDLIDRGALDEEAAEFLKDVSRAHGQERHLQRPARCRQDDDAQRLHPVPAAALPAVAGGDVPGGAAPAAPLQPPGGGGGHGRGRPRRQRRVPADAPRRDDHRRDVSEEAIEFIMGLNLGITAFTTTHAHSARLALTRIETLSRGSGIPLEERREIIGSGLDLAVHIHKGYDPDAQAYRRYMREIMAVNGVSRTGRGRGVRRRDHQGVRPAAQDLDAAARAEALARALRPGLRACEEDAEWGLPSC